MSKSVIQVKKLDWDSEYFGVKSARMDLLSQVCEPELREQLCALDEMDFICISNHDCNIENNHLIARLTNAYTVDINIQFEKKISPTINEEINPTNGTIAGDFYPFNSDIYDIAQNDFRYSRFMTDKRLSALGGQNIYTEWVKNSFSKDGKFFLVESIDKSACGFALFSIENDILIIELIGVSNKYQGLGVGKKLWHNIEQEAALRGCTAIHVGTQLINRTACNFYIRCGCHMASNTQIYHLWLGEH
ncbi:MAG: GNAT family N-acetyltransferase [Clostridia bacterium]|nr:GNAT family N-acetyltransferase [Clostridia bacterium]